jgi:hypothetical protein
LRGLQDSEIATAFRQSGGGSYQATFALFIEPQRKRKWIQADGDWLVAQKALTGFFGVK